MWVPKSKVSKGNDPSAGSVRPKPATPIRGEPTSVHGEPTGVFGEPVLSLSKGRDRVEPHLPAPTPPGNLKHAILPRTQIQPLPCPATSSPSTSSPTASAHTPERQSQRPAFVAFRDAARRLFQDFAAYHEPNETQTEQELIRPLLQLLGWTDDISQPTAPGGEDRPDLLLYQDTQAKARATSSETSPYLKALAVAELKPFRRLLDTRGPGKGTQASSPHAQILRYLRSADTVTDGNLRWGILTNGAVWRLYDQQNRTAFYEANLQALLDADDQDALRTFHLLFRRSAFLRRPGAATAFVETALAEGKRYEQRVAQSLAGVVFQRVFPRLLQALADATDQPMPAIREAALIFLYRLLFVLYAEDRGLLPVNDAAYDDYGLRKRVRDDVAQTQSPQRHLLHRTASSYYEPPDRSSSRQIDVRATASIGLPPYNGGLFAKDAADLLNQVRLPDDVIADVVHDLSHTKDAGQPRYVNYRDMSVQQLGSIYERLLEQEPLLAPEGKVLVRPNPYARKDSGSFYTPQNLVDLIVENTLEPLIEERKAAFKSRANELRSDRRPRAERRAELAHLDSAQAILDLKVLDPAMGSGHFLVTAVDVLTDNITELIEPAPEATSWLGEDDAYHSPLLGRVATIRADILKRATDSGWAVNESQLTDQAIIRRLVLKRCIYGVDKNPLTVELAKVSLWLHSFTVGAPLSFLDHHLRQGDSLLGLSIADARADLRRLETPLFVDSALQGFEAATESMNEIELRADADVSEVHESQLQFQDVESATAGLRGFLDTLGGLRWLSAGMKVRQRAIFEAPIAETLGADPSRAYEQLAHSPADHPNSGSMAFRERWTEARSAADEQSFLHWEAAFPGVWRHWQNQTPEGGFDAVIGNPPWDRIKLQEVEWFATRDPELARAPTAAARRQGIQTSARARRPTGRILRPGQIPRRPLGPGRPRLRPLPATRRRRHQPLFPLRRALPAPGQTRRPRRPAHPLRHLRRQDRRPLLQVRFNHRPRRRHLRLREPPPRNRPAALLQADIHARIQVLRPHRRRTAAHLP